MKTLLLIPILGTFGLYFKPSKTFALGISIVTMLNAIGLYFGMDKKSTEFQYVFQLAWENKEISFGLDGIGINYVLLTTILIPICLLVS